MALTYTYPDAYLSALVTESREARAVADVADLGTMPVAWGQRLVILRAYVITSMESQKAPDDLFAAKLSAYRKEYDTTLTQARIAQAAIDGGSSSGGGSVFSVDLQRA